MKLEHPIRKKPRLNPPKLIVKIVSASYGPCEGKRLLTGELSNDEEASIPYTRDVTPYLRAVLSALRYQEDRHHHDSNNNFFAPSEDADDHQEDDPRIVRLNAIAGTGGGGMKRAQIRLSNMPSMNCAFGDPCPGTSKRLDVHYIITEDKDDDVAMSKEMRAAAAEVHHESFAEHETVVLRRQVRFYQEDETIRRAAARAVARTTSASSQDGMAMMQIDVPSLSCETPNDHDDDDMTLVTARKLGRSQSIAEIQQEIMALSGLSLSDSKASRSYSFNEPKVSSITMDFHYSPRQWRLRSAVSEVVLPIVMPFLEVKERVQCRLVCTSWRNIVRDWGVTTSIDNGDASFPSFTRPFFRGLLANSHSSLQSLFLSGFEDLQKDDFHPSIPFLRNLRSLDISRCIEMDDSTLRLLATHVGETLEVLYIKGLRKASDTGVIAICQSCSKLQVLELSQVPITDQAGIAVGRNLTKLRALYLRDNFRLTNQSIDLITECCCELQQLTLWGCIKVTHLSFGQMGQDVPDASGKLMMLNLWGCLNLQDESAKALWGMSSLRSLIVSECHRLTDAFVISISEAVPQLNHLNLNYCKKLTDVSINAIAQSMGMIFSLDLGFCTNISETALCTLLETRGDVLSELRLRWCWTLDLGTQPGVPATRGVHRAGWQMLNAIAVSGMNSRLSILDVRHCKSRVGPHEAFPETDSFVQRMKSLGFDQKIPGFFVRPTRWNETVEQLLIDQFLI